MAGVSFSRRGLAGFLGLGAAPLVASQATGRVDGDGRFRLLRRAAVSRAVADKLAESVSIEDFGAVRGQSVNAAMASAFASFPPDRPGVLLVPPGDWVIDAPADWSAFRHVTLRIEQGAVFRHGANAMLLPARVETGTTPHPSFAGEGPVYARDSAAVDRAGLPKGWRTYPNFAMGIKTLTANISGTNNFAWGANALRRNTSGSANIAIGNDTLVKVEGGAVPAPGTQTGYGWNNVAIGDTALRDCSTGYENLAIGAFCLQQTTIGKWNVAIGHASQILATDGECNISLGAYALVTNFGSNNLAIGWAALEAQVTGSNIAIGHMAMNANVTGTLNTAIGAEALMRLQAGDHNVAVGLGTLTNLKTGLSNTAIGNYALSSAKDGSTGNTAVGRDALILLATGSGNTAIGAGALSTLRTFNNCTGVGAATAVTGDNQLQLGRPETVPHAFAPLQIRSDARDKADVRDTRLGLAFVNALRPVDFRWNVREDYEAQPEAQRGSLKRTRYHHGFLAQDIRSLIEEQGSDFGGFQDHAIKGGDDVLSLGYAEFTAPIIKAMQELSAEVTELRRQVESLQAAGQPSRAMPRNSPPKRPITASGV